MVVEPSADLAPAARELPIPLQDEVKELLAPEAQPDVAQDVELVGDDDIGMGVDQRTDQTVSTARMTDEQAKGFDITELPPARPSYAERANVGRSDVAGQIDAAAEDSSAIRRRHESSFRCQAIRRAGSTMRRWPQQREGDPPSN